MRSSRALLLVCSLAILPQTSLFSQSINLVGENTQQLNGGPTAGLKFKNEYSAEYSYVGAGNINRGTLDYGNFTEMTATAKYTASTAVSPNVYLRGGFNYDYFSFDLPIGGTAVPNSFQGIAPTIGADFELSDKWLLRVEVAPGIYSDMRDITFDDVNIPTIIGASYLVNDDLQYFYGISINPRAHYFILPGGGIRWKFAKDWTLYGIFPKPRIQYQINEKAMAFIGGDIKTGVFTVADDFGTQAGIPSLNNDAMEYTELRIGAGASYEVFKGGILTVDAGYMVYRSFVYKQSDLQLHSEPAPYVQIGLSGKF